MRSLDYRFVFPLPDGLHARPASTLADVAVAFAAEISLTNERTGACVDAKSMLSVIGADVRRGDSCLLQVTGPDGESAFKALCEFVELVLPFSDDPPVEDDLQTGRARIPRSLRSHDLSFVPGAVIHHGIGQGRVVFLQGLSLPSEFKMITDRTPEEEEEALTQAMEDFRKQLEAQLSGHTASAAAIIKSHLSVLNDSAFFSRLQRGIREHGSAGRAVVDAGRHFMEMLSSGSGYVRERVVDVQEVCLQLLRNLYGHEMGIQDVHLTEPSIVVAEQLGPRQLLMLDRTHLRGLVVGEMSRTSHAAILARAFDVPTLSGIKGLTLRQGQPVVVDAQQGILITSINAAVSRYYEKELVVRTLRNEKLVLSAHSPAVTADGRRLEIAANISAAEEVEPALTQGAEAVGLFRTEMLYMLHDSAPSEELQFEIYRKALLKAVGRSVVIRMVDIGGDKAIPYLKFSLEKNPFLGYRGVRIYREHFELFETQLRAAVRASAFGKVRLLIPMVSAADEILWIKDRIAELQNRFRTEGVAFDPDMELGVMIETPAAVFSIRALSAAAGFFSIGTNDLSQYFFAADRTNDRVSNLCNVHDPSFLQLLLYAVNEARACGKWIGMCGEMARDPQNLPLLVGMGLNEISIGAGRIPRIKQALSVLREDHCRDLLQKCLRCATAGEVEQLLLQMDKSSEARLLDTDLIRLDSDSTTKEEAIRELVNALYICGRTDDPAAVEEAIWLREITGATGVGFGFGVPHCRCDAVKENSIGIARFRKPFVWGSAEDGPVQMIILLALRECNSGALHMKIFSKLARKLMHDDFRRSLLGFATEQEVVLFLKDELGL